MYQPHTKSVTYIALILINASVLVACKSHPAQNKNPIEGIAEQELGFDHSIDFNESKTYALCQQTLTNDHVNSIVKYVVIDIPSKTVVQKGSFQGGYVKWINNQSIEVATSDTLSPTVTKRTIQIVSNKN